MKIINVKTQDSKNTIYSIPDSCVLRNNEDFYMPDFSEQIVAYLSLVIKIKKIGKNINEQFSPRYYDEISLGLKFEATDILETIKEEGLPWDKAVAFDFSAPLGEFTTKKENQELQLSLDNKPVYSLNTSNINVNQIISETSRLYTLKIGDLIYISNNDAIKIQIGQRFTGKINDYQSFICDIK